MYHLTATIEATHKDLDIVRSELAKLVSLTRAEPQCLRFDVFENQKVPGEFVMWESWENEQALKDHFDQAHTKAFTDQNLTQLQQVVEMSPV